MSEAADPLLRKFTGLLSALRSTESAVLAFSGGVDSSFLLHRAHSLKKLNIIGVTIRTPYIPGIEIKEASDFAKKFGINHRILDLTFPESIRYNPSS